MINIHQANLPVWAVFQITSACKGDTGYYRRYEVAPLGEEKALAARDLWADESHVERMTVPLTLEEAEEDFYFWAQ